MNDKTEKSIRLFIFIFVFLFGIGPTGFSQTAINKSFNLFEEEEVLNVRLAFDIGKFMKEKSEEEKLDAEIRILKGDVEYISENITVSARGNYRRRTCDFPPVMLNFKGVETGFTDIDNLKKVKLVSHCMPDDEFRTYVLREYMAYKVYNILSDYSFRVRLLNIEYYDINYDTLHTKKYGFILEPVDELEDRFGMDEIEDIHIDMESVSIDNLMKLSVYQYMLGNSDWFVPTIHNLKIFGDEDIMEDLIAVPYDFDYTGWVDTHYAVAREDLGLEEIRERAFLGPCLDRDGYSKVLDHFLSAEEKIIDSIKDFKYLKAHERRDLVRYVRSFYKLFNNDKMLDICMEPCSK